MRNMCIITLCVELKPTPISFASRGRKKYERRDQRRRRLCTSRGGRTEPLQWKPSSRAQGRDAGKP